MNRPTAALASYLDTCKVRQKAAKLDPNAKGMYWDQFCPESDVAITKWIRPLMLLAHFLTSVLQGKVLDKIFT